MYILLQKYRLRVEHTACSLLKKNLYMKFINTQCLAYPLLSLLSSSFIVCVLKFPTSTRLPQLLLHNFFFFFNCLYLYYTTHICMYVCAPLLHNGNFKNCCFILHLLRFFLDFQRCQSNEITISLFLIHIFYFHTNHCYRYTHT